MCDLHCDRVIMFPKKSHQVPSIKFLIAMSSQYPQYPLQYAPQYPSTYEQPIEQPVQQQQAVAQDDYLARFGKVVKLFDISNFMARKLRQLEQFDIAFILDDSGSMNTPLKSLDDDPFAPTMTRWQELQNAVTLGVSIAGILDRDGCDIFTMNRGDAYGVSDPSQLAQIFGTPAAGVTPLNDTLERAFAYFKANPSDKKKLVLIFTDGVPTDQYGNREGQIAKVKKTLNDRQTAEDIFVVFIKATDGTESDYLDGWDKELKRVDVCDDMVTERDQIRKIQGANFAFSSGDHVCKTLLGSIDPEVDKLDEVKISV